MALTKRFAARLNRLAKKMYLIEMLGGECEHCGEIRFHVMNFHHDSEELEKSFNVCGNNSNRLSDLVDESKKCILLCANCHQKHHMRVTNEYERRTNTKRTMFEYMGTSACKCCGENDSRILNFHHIRDKTINISKWITNKNIKTIDKLDTFIKLELDKCVLLCPNCHLEEHLDKEFNEKYFDLITEKSKNLRENVKPLDRELVKEMYLSGMKQIDIAKHFGSVKSTVSDILKTFDLTKPISEIKYDRDLILKMHGEGKFNDEIMKELGCRKNRLMAIYKELGIKSNVNPDRNKATRKFDPTPEELYNLLETKNCREIGEMFGVSGVAVFYRKRKFDKMKEI